MARVQQQKAKCSGDVSFIFTAGSVKGIFFKERVKLKLYIYM